MFLGGFGFKAATAKRVLLHFLTQGFSILGQCHAELWSVALTLILGSGRGLSFAEHTLWLHVGSKSVGCSIIASVLILKDQLLLLTLMDRYFFSPHE